MNLLDLSINFIEALVISFFIAKYLSIDKIQQYVSVSTIIIFLEISISNYIREFSQLLIVIIILTSMIMISIFQNKCNFMALVVCLVSMIILLLSNYISLFLISIISGISIFDIPLNINIFYVSILLSKTIYFLVILLILYFNKKITYRKKYNDWIKNSLLLTIILLLILSLLIEGLLTNNLSYNLIITLVIGIIALTIVFIILFYKLQKENDLNLKYRLDLQKSYYTRENYLKIRKMNNQIKDAEHHINYVLLQLKNDILGKEYSKALETLDDYITRMKQYRTYVDTENPYFNFVLNNKIHDLQKQQLYLICNICIRESNIYDCSAFCNLLVDLIDEIALTLKKETDIQLSITDFGEYIFLQIIFELEQNNLLRLPIELQKLKIEYTQEELGNNCYCLKMVLSKELFM